MQAAATSRRVASATFFILWSVGVATNINKLFGCFALFRFYRLAGGCGALLPALHGEFLHVADFVALVDYFVAKDGLDDVFQREDTLEGAIRR